MPRVVFWRGPHRIFVAGEDLEVLGGQLQGMVHLQLQVGPTPQKAEGGVKQVQAESITAVIRHVGHEDVDLKSKEWRKVVLLFSQIRKMQKKENEVSRQV